MAVINQAQVLIYIGRVLPLVRIQVRRVMIGAFRINRPDNENARCDGSNRLDKRSDFYRFTGSSRTSSG